MAATATSFLVQHLGRVQSMRAASSNRTRVISPRAGHALEMLAHAIEYLTDEYVHDAKRISVDDPQVQAIQLLMALNRQIYFECPLVPTFGARIRDFFHREY
jgi:hypothetical protein